MARPIAVHPTKGTFSDRWIQYCEEHGISHRIVNCYSTDIIAQLRDCSALLWHIRHGTATDLMIGRHVLLAAAAMGLKVFPDHNTAWHFDDKIAQKYLLEAIHAPLVPSWVFYNLEGAIAWIETASFPKVFKLRRGSGSRNVRLARTKAQAASLARQAFSGGFRLSGTASQELWKVTHHWRKRDLTEFLMGLPGKARNRLRLDRAVGRERGYVYFQEFMAANEFDTRISIIGNRAFGFTRNVRPGDFRASGSGRIVFDRSRIDPAAIRIAFHVAQTLQTQSCAFDFVNDGSGRTKICEISFGYEPGPVHDAGGFWDLDLNWHEGPTWPEDAILGDLLDQIQYGGNGGEARGIVGK